MPQVVAELLIIFSLILVNGVFALSEMAVVSSRKSRLQHWASRGNTGAKAALELANDPRRFLATVQIGITLAAMLTGVFGGATLADRVEALLSGYPVLKPYAQPIGFWTVVVVVSYLTLILGELAPKRIGVNNAERVACLVAPSMLRLSKVMAPVVRLLTISTDAVLIGMTKTKEPPVTSDEIKFLVQQGAEAGVLQQSEEDLVKSVLRLASKKVTALMTPRPRLIWLDITSPHEKLMSVLTAFPPTRLLVAEGELDNLHGYVFMRHLLAQPEFASKLDIVGCLKQPLYLPKTKTGLQVLEMFKAAGTHMAVVLDEYGGVFGVVTMSDLLDAIVGDVEHTGMPVDQKVIERTDGSWFLDGMLPVDRFKEVIGVDKLPDEEKGHYQTLAGFIMNQVGHVPDLLEQCQWENYVFHVAAMKGRTIEKVRVYKIAKSDPSAN